MCKPNAELEVSAFGWKHRQWQVDEMLAIEATWPIKSTDLTVAQIADRLNFASSPSFCKFYKRMRAYAPLALSKQ